MEKICSKCGGRKSENEFPVRNSKTGKRHGICLECYRAYSKEHYKRNKKAYNERRNRHCRIYRERNRKFLHDYLRRHPCSYCGFEDIRALEFHHQRGEKKENISILSGQGRSLSLVEREISKCVVLCANCHKIVHFQKED